MKQQLLFNLQDTERRSAFLVSPCNREAADYLENWPEQNKSGAVLYGPAASGKTHLLHLWAEKQQAQILVPQQLTPDGILAEDAERLSGSCFALDDADLVLKDGECAQALFHLYNLTAGGSGIILLTASTDIGSWDCPLPDLTSRLKTFAALRLLPPDDHLLETLLVKFFSDRQAKIPAEVITYILRRTERDCAALLNLAEEIDAAALMLKRSVSVPLVREIFDNRKKNIELPL